MPSEPWNRRWWVLTPEELSLRVATCQAVANHIRNYRGHPMLERSEEAWLARMETLLRQYRFRIELSPRQLAVVWEIIDRIDALERSPALAAE